GDAVVVEGRVRAIDGALWRAAAGAASGDVIARIFAEAPADAEARTLVGTPPAPAAPTRKPTWTPQKVALGDAPVVALAVQKDGAVVALCERETLTFREGQPLTHAPIGLPLAATTSRALLGGIAGGAIGLSTRAGAGIPIGTSPDGR